MAEATNRASAPLRSLRTETAAVRDIPAQAPETIDALGLRLAEMAVAQQDHPARARALASCLAESLDAEVALFAVLPPPPSDSATREAPKLRLLAAAPPQTTGRAASRSLRTLAERALRDQRLVTTPATKTTRVACALPCGEVVIAARASSVGGQGPNTATTSATSLGATLVRLAPVLTLALAQSPSPSPIAPVSPRPAPEHASRDSDWRQHLLSLAAHDLRTPLNTLNGFLEIVYDEMAGPLNEKQREFLGYARSSVQQVALLFEDVLVLSRGARAPRTEALALADVLDSAIHAVEPIAEAARAMVQGKECATSLMVLGEREALGHALGQVLANALLVTPAGGAVRVATRHYPEADCAEVTIIDAGPPISAEECAALMTEELGNEERGHATPPVEGPRGAGSYRLRLAVARIEVERLGGTLTLTPGRESGLIVRVALPLAE